MTTPRESHVGAPDLRAATQSQSQSLALLRFARLYVLAALAVLLMLIPFDDPWLALTLRGLVVAAVVYAAMTAWRRWIISALLAASVLLMAPSFFGERTGWVGIGLAVVAAMFSVLRQLYRNTEKSCLSIPVAVAPLALLCAYWALVNSAATLVPLSYTLALIVVVIVFRGDAEAVRDALLLVSTFVALVGYAWFATTLAHAVTGIVPTRLSSEGYELRANFGYWSSGPFTITTNSTGFFGIRRASAIGGEPGTWALVATLGTCVAGALCRNKSTIRRLLLVGGALAVISSQSTGAFVAIIAAAAASLALSSVRKRSRSTGQQRIPFALVAAVLISSLPFVLTKLVDLKASANVDSLVARGLGFLSDMDSSTIESRISLLSAFRLDGVIIALPIVGLLCLVLMMRHDAFTFFYSVFFLIMGLLVQPVHWHFGIWFACILVAMLYARPAPVAARVVAGRKACASDSNPPYFADNSTQSNFAALRDPGIPRPGQTPGGSDKRSGLSPAQDRENGPMGNHPR